MRIMRLLSCRNFVVMGIAMRSIAVRIVAMMLVLKPMSAKEIAYNGRILAAMISLRSVID